jgi:formyltetrahydrofolate hydrolase
VGSIPIVSTTVESTAVLLISCPDKPGIVAAVATWIASVGGNIVHAEQHTDLSDSMFFQRVEFTHASSTTLATRVRPSCVQSICTALQTCCLAPPTATLA